MHLHCKQVLQNKQIKSQQNVHVTKPNSAQSFIYTIENFHEIKFQKRLSSFFLMSNNDGFTMQKYKFRKISNLIAHLNDCITG